MTRSEQLPARLRAFFEANPDEELTPEDIAIKFDVTSVNVEDALRYMRKHGQVKVQRVVLVTKGGA